MVVVGVKRKEAEAALGVKLRKSRLRYPGDFTHEQFALIYDKRLLRGIRPEHTPHGLYYLYRSLARETRKGLASRLVFSGEYEWRRANYERMDRKQFEEWLRDAHKRGLLRAREGLNRKNELPAAGKTMPLVQSPRLKKLAELDYDKLEKFPHLRWLLRKPKK